MAGQPDCPLNPLHEVEPPLAQQHRPLLNRVVHVWQSLKCQDVQLVYYHLGQLVELPQPQLQP